MDNLIGKNIIKFREAKNLDQENFAKLVGEELETIVAIEFGMEKPNATQILKISKILEIEATSLLSENQNTKKEKIKTASVIKGQEKKQEFAFLNKGIKITTIILFSMVILFNFLSTIIFFNSLSFVNVVIFLFCAWGIVALSLMLQNSKYENNTLGFIHYILGLVITIFLLIRTITTLILFTSFLGEVDIISIFFTLVFFSYAATTVFNLIICINGLIVRSKNLK